MNFRQKSKAKLNRIFANLQTRALVYSLLIHLGFVLIYFIATFQAGYDTFDFGTEADFSSMPQSQGKVHKKLTLTEAPKEVKKKEKVEKSTEGTEKSDEADDSAAESSEDAADIANAADLSFYPNAATPQMMGSLKQYYPELARQLNIEAAVYVSVVINKSGKVIKVKVSNVTLSKKLPPDRESDLKQKFAAAISRSLKEVRFSPPSVDGKNIPIEMEQVVRYKLN